MTHASLARSLSAVLLCLFAGFYARSETLYDALLNSPSASAAINRLKNTFGKDSKAADEFFRLLSNDQRIELTLQNEKAMRALLRTLPMGAPFRHALETMASPEDSARLIQLAATVEFDRLDEEWQRRPLHQDALSWAIAAAVTGGTLTAALVTLLEDQLSAQLPLGLTGAGLTAGWAISTHWSLTEQFKRKRTTRQRQWLESAIYLLRSLKQNNIPLSMELVRATGQFAETVAGGFYAIRRVGEESLVEPVPHWEQMDTRALNGELLYLYQNYEQYFSSASVEDDELAAYSQSWIAHVLKRIRGSERLTDEKAPDTTAPLVRRLGDIVRRASSTHLEPIQSYQPSEYTLYGTPEPASHFVELKKSEIASPDRKQAVVAYPVQRFEKRWMYHLPAEMMRQIGNNRSTDIFLPLLDAQLGDGFWFKYPELTGEKFFFVPVGAIPAKIPDLALIGSVEIWKRPWVDHKPIAQFPAGKEITRKMIRAALKLSLLADDCPQDLALAANLPVTIEVY